MNISLIEGGICIPIPFPLHETFSAAGLASSEGDGGLRERVWPHIKETKPLLVCVCQSQSSAGNRKAQVEQRQFI